MHCLNGEHLNLVRSVGGIHSQVLMAQHVDRSVGTSNAGHTQVYRCLGPEHLILVRAVPMRADGTAYSTPVMNLCVTIIQDCTAVAVPQPEGVFRPDARADILLSPKYIKREFHRGTAIKCEFHCGIVCMAYISHSRYWFAMHYSISPVQSKPVPLEYQIGYVA